MLELRGRTAVELAKCGAEVTVTGEAEVEAERRQIVILGNQVEGSCKTHPKLIAIEGQALYLLEHLRKIDRRPVNLGGNLGQSPAPRQITGQCQLDAVDQAAPSEGGSRHARGTRAESAMRQRQCKTFCFQGFRDPAAETVPEHGHQRLCSPVDSRPLLAKCKNRYGAQKLARSEFSKQRLLNDESEAGIAAGHRVADTIAFMGVEEDHLVRFSDGLIVAQVPDKDAAIWKHQLRGLSVLFLRMITVGSCAIDITDGDDGRVKKQVNVKLRCGDGLTFRTHTDASALPRRIAAQAIGEHFFSRRMPELRYSGASGTLSV